MEQVCICSYRPNQKLQEHRGADAGFAKPICPSWGICKFSSSAMQQQSNEIAAACSLAANHVGGICFDAIPTPPNEVRAAPLQ